MQLCRTVPRHFESHAHRVYESGTTAVIKAANDLVKRFREGVITAPFTVREVARFSFLAGLMSQEQYADYLNVERECGKS